ncbi:hypothetical protein EIP91_008765 [Steccherinum ochraceum]|uniref:Uncharacterized protein n=1 Tax=Steccherinum ochraceum TaxID=92696 RepID=A0A4R0R2E8_9APHY|nr:hypothetical protein EIP91_008765 [Steccherinum ochraceum]
MQPDEIQRGGAGHIEGVSKKCCPFCWELGNSLRDKHKLDIVLPGNHSVFSPWVPPIWLSDDVLSDLEDVFLGKMKDLLAKFPYFSAQSSPRSESSAMQQEASDADAKEAITRRIAVMEMAKKRL